MKVENTDLAHKWHDSLQESLDIFFILDKQTREDFIEILWSNAILDHIAPTDPAVIEARKAKKRPVWDSGREDPRLYWRILYSAAAAKEAVERNWSVVAGSDNFVVGIFSSIYSIYSKGLVQKLYPDAVPNINPQLLVLNDILERAKQELVKRNQNTEGHPLKYESKGTWRRLGLKVDRFTGSGEIYFQTKSIEDHTKLLYELAAENQGRVLPWEIETVNFD